VTSVLFALLTALFNGTASVLQRLAAEDAPQSRALHLSLFAYLIRRKVWLAGIGMVILAAVCQAIALDTGPVALVQPIFIIELPFTLLVASRVNHRRLPRLTWYAVGLVTVSLGAGLAAAAPSGGSDHASTKVWVTALIVTGAFEAVVISVGAAADDDRFAGDVHQRVEERRDVHRDPHAAVRDGRQRDVGVAMDGVRGADEEDRVVHLAERDLDPAGHEDDGLEVAGRRDGVTAAAAGRAEVVAAARGDVADQLDIVVAVQDENLAGQVDLDPVGSGPRSSTFGARGWPAPAASRSSRSPCPAGPALPGRPRRPPACRCRTVRRSSPGSTSARPAGAAAP
jgi:hypothetical protein